MYYFFKPIFYRKDTDEVLFVYDLLEEIIEIQRFTVEKEFKTTKDCFKKFKDLSDYLDGAGITEVEAPFAKSKIKNLHGLERSFFFNVKVKKNHKTSDYMFWLKPEEYLQEKLEEFEIAWWDQAQLRTYILRQ